MTEKSDKIACETPTPGKKPTNIDRWKYDLISGSILEILPTTGDGIAFRDLSDLVSETLSEEERREIGSISWYTTTVKLDLEVKGKIERVPGVSPQRLLRSG